MKVGEPWHGTLDGYSNHDCRCSACKAAVADYNAALRQVRHLRIKKDPSLAEHGKSNTYLNWGCRCDPCTAAHSAAHRAWKKRSAS